MLCIFSAILGEKVTPNGVTVAVVMPGETITGRYVLWSGKQRLVNVENLCLYLRILIATQMLIYFSSPVGDCPHSFPFGFIFFHLHFLLELFDYQICQV